MFNDFVVQPIFNLLMLIYSVVPGGDFGVALIIFTILVRVLMWPLIKKQLHQTKAMQRMQPELVKIKKQAKGDKRAEGLLMMELYKKYDINPFRSIGILLIQLPIFIALFSVIQTFTAHRDQIDGLTYGFLKDIGPIKDIIADPSNFKETLFGLFDLTHIALTFSPFSVDIFLMSLSILAAIMQYFLVKQTMPTQQNKKSIREILREASQGKQADQSEVNTAMMGGMAKFLPFMMLVIMVYLPGALVLYYTVSNIVAYWQQSVILKGDTEEMIDIADQATVAAPKGKKATAKARLKQASEANITRIVAKDNRPKKEKM
jgi:YidC/Oxa1 family membrane protein insertase